MSAEVETLPLSNGMLISPFAQKVQRAPIPDCCDEIPHKAVLLNGNGGCHADDPPSGPPSVRTNSPVGSEPRQQSGSTPSSAHQQSVGTAGSSGPQQSGSTPGSGASQQQQQQQQQPRVRTGFLDLFHSSAADAGDGETTASSSNTTSGGIAAALLSAMRRTTGQNGSTDGNAVKVFPNGDRYIGLWRDGQVGCSSSLRSSACPATASASLSALLRVCSLANAGRTSPRPSQLVPMLSSRSTVSPGRSPSLT